MSYLDDDINWDEFGKEISLEHISNGNLILVTGTKKHDYKEVFNNLGGKYIRKYKGYIFPMRMRKEVEDIIYGEKYSYSDEDIPFSSIIPDEIFLLEKEKKIMSKIGKFCTILPLREDKKASKKFKKLPQYIQDLFLKISVNILKNKEKYEKLPLFTAYGIQRLAKFEYIKEGKIRLTNKEYNEAHDYILENL